MLFVKALIFHPLFELGRAAKTFSRGDEVKQVRGAADRGMVEVKKEVLLADALA